MGKTIGVVLALKDKCSPQLEKIANKMGMDIKQAEKLDRQVKKLSKELREGMKKACTVCTAAIVAMTAATQQLVFHTMQAGDRVDKMSQKIGMSRKAFQEWDYIMSQNGSSVDTLQMGYKKLASQMEGVKKGSKESIKLFSQLGVKVKDSNGQFRTQEDVFNDSVRALQKMKNPTEKAIIANNLFGKSAIELKPLLNQTADATDALKQRANDLGMVMSDEAIDASVKLTDTMDTIKRSMGGLGLYIGSQFLPVIQDMSDKFLECMPKIKATVTPILQGLLNVISFVTDHIKGLSIAVGAMVGIFATCTIINTTAQALSTLQNTINLVKEAQSLWFVVQRASVTLQNLEYIKTMALIGIKTSYTAVLKAFTIAQRVANITMLGCPLWAIVAGVTAIIGVLVLAAKNWDSITETVKNWGKTAINWVVNVWDKIKPIFEKIKKAAEIAFSFTPAGMIVNGVKAIAKNAEKPKKHALGTSYSTGGPAIVGEYGPELINLKRGDSVITTPKTQQILKSNTQKIEINVNIAGNLIGNGEFLQQLKNALALELNTALATV